MKVNIEDITTIKCLKKTCYCGSCVVYFLMYRLQTFFGRSDAATLSGGIFVVIQEAFSQFESGQNIRAELTSKNLRVRVGGARAQRAPRDSWLFREASLRKTGKNDH